MAYFKYQIGDVVGMKARGAKNWFERLQVLGRYQYEDQGIGLYMMYRCRVVGYRGEPYRQLVDVQESEIEQLPEEQDTPADAGGDR